MQTSIKSKFQKMNKLQSKLVEYEVLKKWYYFKTFQKIYFEISNKKDLLFGGNQNQMVKTFKSIIYFRIEVVLVTTNQ